MSASLDFNSLKLIKPKDKSIVFGYIRSNFTQSTIQSSENLINYTILSFYHDNCDIFTSFMDNYDISEDGKCFSGCGYGNHVIDPNDSRYNKYQWRIKINACKRKSFGTIFGIVPKINTELAWCYELQPTQYNFSSCGALLPRGCFKPGFRHLKVINTKYQTDDIVILELDTNTKEFKLFVNGRLGGLHENINTERGITYRLGCLVSEGPNFITLEAFSKFKDGDNDTMNNLLNYNGKFTEREHPSRRCIVAYEYLWCIGPRADAPGCTLYRVYMPAATEWKMYWYKHKYNPFVNRRA